MTADALLVLQTLFGSIWRLFVSWYIPGTNVTPAAFFVFLMFAPLVIRFFAFFMGVGVDSFNRGNKGDKGGDKGA